MKKLKLLLFISTCLLFSFGIMAQTNDQLISNVLGQNSSISSNFINGMIQTGKVLNFNPKSSTDFCDPWDETKPCPPKAKMKAKIAASPEMQVAIIKNTMKHFEQQAIATGKGGKFLTKKLLLKTQRKYPGYERRAMKSRFNMYIKHLRSVKE